MDRVTSIGDRGAPNQGRGGAGLMRGDAHRHVSADVADPQPHGVDTVADFASVLGLAEGDVPPQIQAVIIALTEEIEKLRAEVTQVRRHEALLREQTDHHPSLKVLHRRSFVRDLGRLLAQARRGGLTGSVLDLHLEGVETLRELHGLEAAESVLSKAIETLKAHIDPADLVGYLEGGNFAVALALVGEAEAQTRARQLADRLAAMPFLLNGQRPSLVVTWSCVPFESSEDAEALLRAAEALRRARHPRRPG